MTTGLVVEGKLELNVLKILLADLDWAQFDSYAAGNYSSLDSLGRSMLSTGIRRLALVADSDSQSRSMVEERRRFLDSSMRDIWPSAELLITLVEPEFEAFFFVHPEVAEAIVQCELTAEDRIVGRYEPKRILAKYLGDANLEERVSGLGPVELDKLRSLPQIAALTEFLSPKMVVRSGRSKASAVAEHREPYSPGT